MTRDDILALADRVEALTGPNKEIDALVTCAASGKPDAFVEQSPFNGAWCVYEPCPRKGKRLSERVHVRPYTASLDAAMGLVPDGWYFGMASKIGKWAEVWQGTQFEEAKGFNLASALAAASLRAIAQGMDA